MNLKHKFIKCFKSIKDKQQDRSYDRDETINSDLTANGAGTDQREREADLYGEKRAKQQRLYEKWIVKDKWLLKDEALPLLLGVDPAGLHTEITSDYRNKIDELWDHAKHCVEQGLLNVIDKEIELEKWMVTPAVIYRCAAVSRVNLPEPFTSLIEFILNTVKHSEFSKALNESTVEVNHIDEGSYSRDKEIILGTALAILAACPDQCRNNRGVVQTGKIIEIINKKGEFWFGDHVPQLSTTAMMVLINRWIKSVN